jgi:hypothetical protein
LTGHGYDVTVVDEFAPFAVVVPKYSDHPEPVFENAVLEVSADDHNVFLLSDEAAVEAAVDDGATRLTATPLRLELSAGRDVGPTTVADVAGRR